MSCPGPSTAAFFTMGYWTQHEFLNEFSTRNIFDDEKLVELTEEAKSVVSGVSPYGLKYNDVMRKKIANGMTNLSDAIAGAIEDMPRRKLQMAVNA